MPLIEGRNLTKRIGGAQILSDLHVRLRPGECLRITGPNGAGKTTLLRILAGVSRPDAGELRFQGRRLDVARPDLRRSIGYLAHEPLLFPDLTGRENLRFYGGVFLEGESRIQREERIEREASFWGFSEALDRPIRTYSRGMRQKAALARSLLHDPTLWILDEPTTSLDAEGKERLRERLERHLALGGAAVMASHEKSADTWGGSRSALLFEGRLIGS